MNANPPMPATCTARRAWIGAAVGFLGGLAGAAALGTSVVQGCALAEPR